MHLTFPGFSSPVEHFQQRVAAIKVELSGALSPGSESFSVIRGCLRCIHTQFLNIMCHQKNRLRNTNMGSAHNRASRAGWVWQQEIKINSIALTVKHSACYNTQQGR